MSRFLDLVNERVVVYDGATGTNLQELGLIADDFGGPELEGCTDILSVTRPDVIATMHDEFFKVGVDVVETASFGSFAVPLAEYGIADRSHELNLAAARIAREAGAKRLALTHFDAEVYKSLPERKASEAIAAGLFAATTAGFDGQEIEI